jgi:hypothetical protein
MRRGPPFIRDTEVKMSCMPYRNLLELVDQMMVTQLKATQDGALSGGTRP